MTKGALTRITSTKPKHLGKQYSLTSHGLVKTTAGQMLAGAFEVVEFSTVSDLSELLQGIGTHQAITTSLPRDGRLSGVLVTKSAKADNPGALARTKEDSVLPEGPGVLILDYDVPPTGEPMSREQLWGCVQSVMAGVGLAGVLHWSSGSSWIYNGETLLQGQRGQRLYILIADLSDTERAGVVLQKRLWLQGYGRIEISKAGSLLLRTTFDAAMHQPARLDFCGGAVCELPLVQKRPSPFVLSSGGWLDTRAALPDLTPEEQARYEDAVEAAKRAAQPEADAVKAAWQAGRKPAMVQRLVASGVAVSEAEERTERTLQTALKGVLMGDFLITLPDGRTVTVGEILDDRAKWHGVQTRDPLEPEYQGSKTCGILYLYGSRPVLSSRAHGGQTFVLLRQPSRLYLCKGGKAELATAIVDRLASNDDVFRCGGLLVQVVDGGVRQLERNALLYLIQTRISFYSKTSNGEDTPIDLPGDVVDMVLAVA
jgi:hypothetical protein